MPPVSRTFCNSTSLLCLCSMFFVASEPRSPLCFGCMSKVKWAFQIKSGARSPLVEKLLTSPFPNCPVSYWQHSGYQGLSIWSITTWSLTICPIMKGFPPTMRPWMECSINPLVPDTTPFVHNLSIGGSKQMMSHLRNSEVVYMLPKLSVGSPTLQ